MTGGIQLRTRSADRPATMTERGAVSNPRQPRPRLRDRTWFQRVVVWGGLLLLWELAARRAGPFFLPTLGSILAGFVAVVRDGALGDLANSLRQLLIGFGLAAAVGVPVGLAMGSSKWVEWAIGMYVRALFVTSLTALLPFLILVFGTGFQFRVAVVFLFAIVYIVINTAAGVRSVDPGMQEMSLAFNAGWLRRFLTVTLPGSLPFVIAGLRLALGQAVQGMIIAELWVRLDTGRRLDSLGLARELGEFFALATIVAVTGAVLTHLLLVAQRRLTPWQPDLKAVLGGRGA